MERAIGDAMERAIVIAVVPLRGSDRGILVDPLALDRLLSTFHDRF